MNGMKSRVSVLGLAAMLCSLCFAQTTEQVRQADHDALRALRTRAVNALNQGDLKALRGCFAKEFVFTTVDQTAITSEEELGAYYTKMFSSPTSLLAKITVDPQAAILTRFDSPDVGYCYGISEDTYALKGGKTVKIPSRWTALLVREDGQWKIQAAHAGMNVLDNPVLNKATSLGYKLGIGGLILGLLVGILGTVLVARTKKAP